MMPSFWARITGADKRKQYPEQQAVALGRVGDYSIVFPYGLYADLPNDILLRVMAAGVAMPVVVDRPSDVERGEPVFFHPQTNTRIIARNDGGLDIEVGDKDLAVNTGTVNITANTSVDITAPITNINGNLTVNGNAVITGTVTNAGTNIGATHTHAQGLDSAGDSQVNTGTPL
jgi:hypothetical protein